MRSDLYVTPDPNSIKRAEEAAARELYAQSAILSVHRQSAEEIAREDFWRRVATEQGVARLLSRMTR